MAKLSDAQLAEIRKRFLTDFEFWAKHACQIRTKDGKIVPLRLNPVQQRFLAGVLTQWQRTGRVRQVVLKARQQGLSTVISAFQYWWLSQRRAQKGLVMAHEAESTTTLFDMYTRIHSNVPEMLRPSTSAKSRNEMVFNVLDTALRVATAGGRGVARGETLTFTHLSEVAFWPTAFAAANFNGLIQAVPDTDNTFIFLESTANGVTGQFYSMVKGAERRENGYDLFFSAWFESAEYREKAPADFQPTPDEKKQADAFGLDHDQLYWRRRKIAQTSADLFRQEYPATPEEAFVSTGRPVFSPDYIYERLKEAKPPLKRMAVSKGSVREDERGELLVYVSHDDGKIVDPSETYTIGADIGMGVRNGDFSVAQILDSRKRQVAVWRGRVHPDFFADILIALGYYFNSALIGPERNNHGLLTCVKIRDHGYPNIYTDVTEGSLDEKDTILIGHFTSERTKPLVIDKLRASEREREIEIYDKVTLEEMLTYVVTENGKMQAEGGCHDDCVMALAIANHIHEGRWEPIRVSDDHYVEAI